MHAQVAFYDTTPTGRILTRFSKDFRDIDAVISSALESYFREGYRVLVLFALIIYGSVYLIAAVVPLSLLFWLYMRFYRRTSVRLQRLEGACYGFGIACSANIPSQPRCCRPSFSTRALRFLGSARFARSA